MKKKNFLSFISKCVLNRLSFLVLTLQMCCVCVLCVCVCVRLCVRMCCASCAYVLCACMLCYAACRVCPAISIRTAPGWSSFSRCNSVSVPIGINCSHFNGVVLFGTASPSPAVTNLSERCFPAAAHPPHPGLALSPATQPFPQRIVDRVLSGEFIEMRELLSDNITLLSQLESFHAYPVAPAHVRPRLWEITSLPSWIYCFLAYVAICTTDFRTRDQLAYARLLVRESLIHPGQGWL